MKLELMPFGEKYTIEFGTSFLYELNSSRGHLRIVLYTNRPEDHKSRYLELLFQHYSGFWVLDGSDVTNYFDNPMASSGHHLYKVTSGGWTDPETRVENMFWGCGLDGHATEWFIPTANDCITVISQDQPLVREFFEDGSLAP